MHPTKSFANTSTLWCVLAVGALTMPAGSVVRAAEVYKHVDAQGHVTYSDHPTSAAAEKIEVQVPAANAVEAARMSKEQAMYAADEQQRAAKKQEQQRFAEAKEIEQRKRMERCAAARARYNNLMTHSRIYKKDDEGNRDYYSANEIDAQRASAKATMDTECSS